MARLKAVFLIAGLFPFIFSAAVGTTRATAAPDFSAEGYGFDDDKAVKNRPPVVPLPARKPARPTRSGGVDLPPRKPVSRNGELPGKSPATAAPVRNVEKPVVKDRKPARSAPVAKPDMSALKNAASGVAPAAPLGERKALPPGEGANGAENMRKASMTDERAMTGAVSRRKDPARVTSAPQPEAVRDKTTKASIEQPKQKPETAGEKSSSQERGVRTVGLPARKPPMRRPAPRTTNREPPVTGSQKTREQQCAALRKCRSAFSKCRFSKKQKETDAEGWEIHKVKCGEDYSKCIKENFRKGEMVFTRWFIPYDRCS